MPNSLFPNASPELRYHLEKDPTVKLFNEFDWSKNELGPIPGWSESLKGGVRTIMVASTPMVMLVGQSGILLYNDAYAKFAGQRHPAIFGMPALEAWPEIADFNRTNIERGLRGEAWVLHDQELVLNRHGRLESGWMDLHYSPIVGDSGQSMGTLCIVHETTDRLLAERALAESELQFRTLADAVPQMVWSTRPDGHHDYYNARWYEYTGVPFGSTDGEGWNGMFHQDDQARAWQQWRHSLATGEPYQIEYRLRHHSGEYRWTLGRALPIRDADSRIVRWIGTCTDIHEARLAAQERELVAQELSHRIKNIFAVLNGIIALSARDDPDAKPFADQLRQRIYALGEAHDFVRPQNYTARGASGQGKLSALIERLMRAYSENSEGLSRIRFIGDDALVDDAAATPLALLFHELATNAAKYGALSTQDGTIEISGRKGDDGYHLTWREQGGPTVATPDRPGGFGSRLVSLSVEGQMRGTLRREWNADGLVVYVVVPPDALDRSSRLSSAPLG